MALYNQADLKAENDARLAVVSILFPLAFSVFVRLSLSLSPTSCHAKLRHNGEKLLVATLLGVATGLSNTHAQDSRETFHLRTSAHCGLVLCMNVQNCAIPASAKASAPLHTVPQHSVLDLSVAAVHWVLLLYSPANGSGICWDALGGLASCHQARCETGSHRASIAQL